MNSEHNCIRKKKRGFLGLEGLLGLIMVAVLVLIIVSIIASSMRIFNNQKAVLDSWSKTINSVEDGRVTELLQMKSDKYGIVVFKSTEKEKTITTTTTTYAPPAGGGSVAAAAAPQTISSSSTYKADPLCEKSSCICLFEKDKEKAKYCITNEKEFQSTITTFEKSHAYVSRKGGAINFCDIPSKCPI